MQESGVAEYVGPGARVGGNCAALASFIVPTVIFDNGLNRVVKFSYLLVSQLIEF